MVEITVPKAQIKKLLEMIRCKSSTNDINQKTSNLLNTCRIDALDDRLLVRTADTNGLIVLNIILKDAVVHKKGSIPLEIDETLSLIDSLKDKVTIKYENKELTLRDDKSGWKTTTISLESVPLPPAYSGEPPEEGAPIVTHVPNSNTGFPVIKALHPETKELLKTASFRNALQINVENVKQLLKAAKVAGKSQKIMLIELKWVPGEDKIHAFAGKIGGRIYDTKINVATVGEPSRNDEIASEFAYGIGNVFSVLKGEVELYFGITNDPFKRPGYDMFVKQEDEDVIAWYYIRRNIEAPPELDEEEEE